MASEAKRKKVGKEIDETSLTLLCGNTDEIQQKLQQLKRLTPFALREKFDELPQLGNSLLTLLWNCSTKDFILESKWTSILEDVLVILKHLTSLSSGLSIIIAAPHANISIIAIRILEGGEGTPAVIKRTMLQVLRHISTNSTCLQLIARKLQLIDQIAMAIGCEENLIVEAALQLAYSLVSGKHGIKPLLLSNIGYYLGNLFVLKNKDGLQISEINSIVFSMISYFVKFKCAKQIGRQLAGSNGVNVLLEYFLDGHYQGDILEMCKASFELREQFESSGCIEKIVHSPQPHSDYMLQTLLCFAQDAWGRAALRVQGALDLLIDRLESGGDQEQELIVNALRYFVHDGSGLNYITYSTKFLDVVVNHVLRFLTKSRRVCKRISEEPEIGKCAAHGEHLLYRAECPCCVRKGITEHCSKIPSPVRLMASFGNDSFAVSLQKLNPVRRSWSPSQSPSPGSSSPLMSSSASPSSLMDDCIEIFEHSLQNIERHKERTILSHSSIQNTRMDVVIGELYILSWLSHIENAPSMASKAPRTIRRIFRHRLAIENLNHLEFHNRVIHVLVTKKCLAGKRLMKCSECSMRADFGDVLLDEFASHTDTAFGLEVIKNLYKSTDEINVIKACIATVHLVRREDNWKRMLKQYQPVKSLLAKLRQILTDSDYQKKWYIKTYDNGPTLIRQILIAFSYLIPNDQMLNSLFSDYTSMYQYFASGLCVIADPYMVPKQISPKVSDRVDYIMFTCGDQKQIVSKKRLCDGSDYFRGMFGHAFSEQSQDTFQFNEEKEQCSFSIFCLFLHFACGCGRSCLKFNEADLPTLLKLFDRYMCSSLSSLMFANDSPIKNQINGHNLPSYLEVLITTGSDRNHVLRDACFSYLLRFCTEDEMFEALKVVAGNQIATDILLERLEEFLMSRSRQRML